MSREFENAETIQPTIDKKRNKRNQLSDFGPCLIGITGKSYSSPILVKTQN